MLPCENLSVSIESSSCIKLEWDNSEGESNYTFIEKKIGSTGTWIEIDSNTAAIKTYFDHKADCNVENFYRVRNCDNLSAEVFFQDLFESVSDVLISAHTPDISKYAIAFLDSLNEWHAYTDHLYCTTVEGSLALNTKSLNYKIKANLLTNGATFDYAFLVNEVYQFSIKEDGIYLYQEGTPVGPAILWSPSGDWTEIEIEVAATFINLKIGATEFKYSTSESKDETVFIILGADGNTNQQWKNVRVYKDQTFSAYSDEASITITTLTIQEIWERYSEIEYERNVYVKRINAAGVYESEWQNINDLIKFETRLKDICGGITYALPNNTYSLGAVNVDNANLSLANHSGQVSHEDMPNSIFHNYIRHKSLVKVVDSFIDAYSYPGSFGRIDQTTFEGFIDDRLCVTNPNDTENIIATDILGTLLKSVTLEELSLTTDQTIKNTVYQIVNRALFTNFFSVSLSNINPGFDATNIDLTEFEPSTTAFDILQELSIGHSIFYVRNGVFYYKAADPERVAALDLSESPQRKIKFNKFSSGGAAVFDKLFWQDATETYTSPTRTYNQVFAFATKGIDHPTQRQGLLDYAGPRLAQRKVTLELAIPFLPILFILDRITILHRGILQEGCFILDISKLDEGSFLEPVGSFTIEATDAWMVRKISHGTNNQTVLTLEKIIT